MNEPKLSVIIPLEGALDNVKSCLECLTAQAFSDFETIFVSSDPMLNSENQIDSRRIKFLRGERKSARQTGLKNATGKYVYFMNADELIFENAFELLIKAAESSDADIVHSTAYVEREGENVKVVSEKAANAGVVGDKNAFAAFRLMPSLNLYRRDFLERSRLEVQTDESFSYAAFFLAAKVFCIAEYFLVRTRKNRLRQVDDEPKDALVERLYHDEFRDGFLVTQQRKKLWNVQLHLIEEFARICKKYGLKWFAYAGTLLGAARHGGFVPWDDDVDLAMMRPDFEKLKTVIAKELKPEYSLDFWYDYAIEGERNPNRLPIVSKEVFESNAWWPSTASYFKIRDNRTSMIEWADRPHFQQGMCIDIFPLDPGPPFSEPKHAKQFQFVTNLMLATSAPSELDWNVLSPKDRKYFKTLLKKPFRDRAREYEKFLADHWFESEYIAHINSIFAYRRPYEWRREWWDELIELPFEKITLPAPSGYDGVLTAHYGDWREMIITHAHSKNYSADISCKEFFQQIAPEVLEHDLH